ncbi:hypothetical protein D3C79_694000 [compost metagenome]
MHHVVTWRELVHVGKHQSQARLNVIGQADAQFVEALAGGEDFLYMAQHFTPGFRKHRMASLAVEQADAQVRLKVGDSGTDGGLTFAQLARRRRE